MKKFLVVLGLSVLLLLLAGLCSLLRRGQTTRVLRGSEVRFSSINDASWDPATRLITRTGGDPYAYLELTKASIPLREVVIEFGGTMPRTKSRFFLYQYPDYLDGLFLNDSNALEGRITPAADHFTVRWVLADSKVARLDLPDDITYPFEIRQVTLVSGSVGGLASMLSKVFLFFGIALPVWAMLRGFVQRNRWVEALIIAGLIALKLYLASDLRLTVIGNAVHDEALFVGQANALMDGHWLGEYNERTLCKGPVFSFFLAAVGLSGAPLQPVQAGLHALACLALLLALRPLLPAAGSRLLFFLILLFDPLTLSTDAVGRVLRSGIQPALAIFVVAGVIGMAVRASDPVRRMLGWSLLAGLAVPLFWFSREEGIWLIPSMLLISGVAVYAIIRQTGAGRWWRLALLAFPLLTYFAGVWTLRSLNARYYGAPIAVDVKEGAFPRAYGALLRIKPARLQSTVPVARETHLRAFAVSPAFAELRPHLEGPVGAFWEDVSKNSYGGDDAPNEIRGGWYQWAMREAAAKAGHYQNAATADAYWDQVAREINAACDRGELAGGPRRSGMVPRWDWSLFRPLRLALGRSFGIVAEFSKFSTDLFTKPNTPEQIAQFVRVTNQSKSIGWAASTELTAVRVRIATIYAWASTPAMIIAALSLLILAVRRWRERRGVLEVAILLALMGGAAALIFIVSLVDATSFAATHPMYLAPATPLTLAVMILAPAWVLRDLTARRRQ